MNRLLVFFLPLCVAVAAGPALSGALEKSPANAATFWAASVKAETSSDYDDALKQLAAFQKEGGDPFMTAMRSGWLCYLKGSYAQAEQSYAAASKIQPTAINPLLGQLTVAQAMQDAKRIERAAEAVFRMDPNNYRAQMALAAMSFSAQNHHKALSIYRRVLSIYPDDIDARSGAAWSSYYLGDKQDALAGFRLILSINPDYAYAQQGYDLAMGKSSRNGANDGKLQPSAGLQPARGL